MFILFIRFKRIESICYSKLVFFVLHYRFSRGNSVCPPAPCGGQIMLIETSHCLFVSVCIKCMYVISSILVFSGCLLDLENRIRGPWRQNKGTLKTLKNQGETFESLENGSFYTKNYVVVILLISSIFGILKNTI